jgi:O-antigen/teichoic acid export membrane protein
VSDRWFNLGLRLISLGSRFLLVILLAKSMRIEDFAFYGLFAAAVTYSVYVIGVDFYTFAVRDLVTQPKPFWRALLRDQFLLYSATFAIFICCSLVLLAAGVISANMLIWLLLLLASEHLAQELSRLLIITGNVLQSSIALFIRSGLWVMILAALWWKNPAAPLQLQQVFTLWLSGGILAIVWSLWCLREVLRDRSSAGAPVDWGRLRTGIRIAAIFFAGTLVLKFVSTADRFLVEHIAGLAAVGPYVLYIGLAGAIAAVVDAAVVLYDYPGLIRAWQAGDEQQFHTLYRAFLRRVLLHALGAALVLALFLRPVLDFIGKQHVLEAWPLAVPLILANVLLALANVPHYALYAARQDRGILAATIIGTAVFLLAAVITGPWLGALAVAWSFCLSALAVLLSKFLVWRRVLRQQIWTTTPQQSNPAHPPTI